MDGGANKLAALPNSGGGGAFESGFFSSVSPKLSSSPFCSTQECQGKKIALPHLHTHAEEWEGLCVTAHGWGGRNHLTGKLHISC